MPISLVTPVLSGWWLPGDARPETGGAALFRALLNVRRPLALVQYNGGLAVTTGGTVVLGDQEPDRSPRHPLCAHVPALPLENLGDPAFRKAHGLRYAYVAGAMANGITSVEMVEAVAKAGMIGFFGAAGLSLDAIEIAIDRLESGLGTLPYGMNLIHSPNDPAHEAATVELYLRRGVRRVSASAYLGLTPFLVRYRLAGIHRDASGAIVCPNRVIAKVSRVEVAERFLSPAPEKILRQLVAEGHLTGEQAELASRLPLAEDISAEADSGGHTDNRPALTLLPTMTALRDRICAKYAYAQPVRVGLGGGIATPESAAAAFAMGAAYILVGSAHQACVEAGTSETVRRMLAEAQQADIAMAPAADMFEMGVKVQVLKRGTMFAQRAAKLYDVYSRYDRWEAIPEPQRLQLEKDFFKTSFEETWRQTHAFFERRDPRQNERAERDPHHKMALVFRSYLGQSSRWAITGVPDRRLDYQIWCGPAMGAFNEWTRGSFLEKMENRRIVTVAMNLLLGASVVTRLGWLRTQGVAVPPSASRFAPMTLEDIRELLDA